MQGIPHSEEFFKPLLKGINDTINDYVSIVKEGLDNPPVPQKPPCISRSKEKEAIIALFEPVCEFCSQPDPAG
jgi:hypothetical protein